MKFIERIKAEEGNVYAIGIAWTIGLLWFSLLGFYLGTISDSKHIIDLQVKEMRGGGLTGLIIGFLVGATIATLVTIFYPMVTAKEAEREAAEAEHGHH